MSRPDFRREFAKAIGCIFMGGVAFGLVAFSAMAVVAWFSRH